MGIARINEFTTALNQAQSQDDIEKLCRDEISYLKSVCSTLNAVRVQLSYYRKAVKELPLNDVSRHRVVEDKKHIFKHYGLEFLGLSKSESDLIDRKAKKRIISDRLNRVSFDPIPLIDTAKNLLDSSSYISKVAGLYLLTGRRHTEIQVCGNFEAFDGSFKQKELGEDIQDPYLEWLDYDMQSCLFSGQLKLKSRSDVIYNIPLLADWCLIKENIDWLRVNKPQPIGERAKGGKELGNKIDKVFRQSGLIQAPSGKSSKRLNPHNLRSAYFCICYNLFIKSAHWDRDEDIEDYFCQILMGHWKETTSNSYKDYRLTSTQVESLINYFY